MATFNAGAIEATLDLDPDPFQRKLEQAKADGRRFAGEKFTAKLDVDAGTTRSDLAVLRAEFERVAKQYTAQVEVNGLTHATADVAALRAQLDGLDGRHTVDVNTSGMVRNLDRAERGIQSMIPALAILATGLIPLTAAAVPALSLANNLGMVALGAGSVVLAMQGVGEAMKAENAAGIAPTAENLAKVHDAMSKLTPEARGFVGELRSMSGAWGDLKDNAATGFFPGGTRALENLETVLPRFNPLVHELGDTMGLVAENATAALDTPRWRKFFGFVQQEARPSIIGLTDAGGNLAGTFASLWEAFAPLEHDFTGWLVSSTGDLRDWADGLKGSQAFADFLDYVRTQGPHAADALGAVTGALVAVVKDAAPIGGVVLDGLTAAGNAIQFIADTPMGPTILAGAAAFYTLNKALGVTEGLMARLGLTSAGRAAASAAGGSTFFGKIGAGATSAGRGIRSLTGDMRAMRAEYPGLSRGQALLTSAMSNTTGAAQRTRSTIGMLSKGVAAGAAAAGAVALMSTDAGRSLGLTNTAMMTLTGAMIGGVPGAVAGGAVGALMDFKNAGDQVTDTIDGWNRALSDNATNWNAYGDILAQARGDVTAFQQDMNNPTFMSQLGSMFDPQEIQNGWAQLTTGTSTLEKMQQEYAKTAEQAQSLEDAVIALGNAYGVDARKSVFGGVDQEKGTQVLEASAAAMQHFGVTYKDLANMPKPELESTVTAMADWSKWADSADGRTATFAASVHALANDALSAADSATQMSDALTALLGPTMDAEAATDAWHTKLKELESTLAAGAGFKGFSDAAMKNKAVTRDYVTTSMDRLSALAKVSTTSEGDMARAVAQTRREFIQSGIAAGMSRKAIVARANALGLTPKLVKTVFEAAGVSQADLRARKLRETYKSLPPKVEADIRANGIPETSAAVDKLVDKYHLTEKQRTALLTIKDLATKPIGDILGKLGILDRTTATPSVQVSGYQGAVDALNAIGIKLSDLNGRTATTYTQTVHKKAGGGSVIGPGTGTSDSIPALLSNGEHVWTAREVANAGGHAAVEAMRASFRFAAGGAVQWKAPPTPRAALSRRQWSALRNTTPGATGAGLTAADVDRIVEAIENNRGVYAQVSSREDLETAMRALERELRRV